MRLGDCASVSGRLSTSGLLEQFSGLSGSDRYLIGFEVLNMNQLHALLAVIAVVVLTSLPPVSSNTALAAGNASISGMVTDTAGEPVRGAIVKAELGNTLHARYKIGRAHV